MKRSITIILLLGCSLMRGQEAISLNQVHDYFVQSSFFSESTKADLELSRLDYSIFQAGLRPQLSVVGDIPNYTKTSSAIVQPDGSIFFQSIRQSNSAVSLFGQQVIAATGTQIFALSNLRRFDDFGADFSSYNGIPVRIGFSQDILGFNPWKYQKSIQAHRIHQAERQYSVNMETSLLQTTDLYFGILVAQQNLRLARTNVKINENLERITEERFALGKISRDERLQVETELKRSLLNVSLASAELNQALAALNTQLGDEYVDTLSSLDLPEISVVQIPSLELLLEASRKHRPEMVSWLREREQLKSDRKQASWENGIQLNLQGSLGLARGAEDLLTVYKDPFTEQQLNLSVQVPILDGKRRKNTLRRIDLQQEILEERIEQETLALDTEIEQRYMRVLQSINELNLMQEIVRNAEERFEISNQRYILGDLDLTNLTLAQQDMNQSQRSYIQALRSYWLNIHQLRILTGYDLVKNQEIIYLKN